MMNLKETWPESSLDETCTSLSDTLKFLMKYNVSGFSSSKMMHTFGRAVINSFIFPVQLSLFGLIEFYAIVLLWWDSLWTFNFLSFEEVLCSIESKNSVRIM
jgi:hypothetical protein